MPVHPHIYANKYCTADWNFMAEAYKLALQQLGSDPFVQKERLARTVMGFYDRGIRDMNLLWTLAVGRERSLADVARAERYPSYASNRGTPDFDDLIYSNGVHDSAATRP